MASAGWSACGSFALLRLKPWCGCADLQSRGDGYSRAVALERLRGRMPLWAFVLLAVLCLALIGLACACFDDQFAQAFERALQAPIAVMEAWPALALVMVASLSLLFAIRASERASPAMLQRFLF